MKLTEQKVIDLVLATFQKIDPNYVPELKSSIGKAKAIQYNMEAEFYMLKIGPEDSKNYLFLNKLKKNSELELTTQLQEPRHRMKLNLLHNCKRSFFKSAAYERNIFSGRLGEPGQMIHDRNNWDTEAFSNELRELNAAPWIELMNLILSTYDDTEQKFNLELL